MLKIRPKIIPPITLKDFLRYTKSDLKAMKRVLNNKNNYYSYFEIPKKKGGTRPITPSHGQLKLIQVGTKNFLNECIKWPFYLHGGIKDKSVITNAECHRKKFMVVNVDVEKCFPNTSDKKINEAFRKCKISAELTDLLTDICTYNKSLPQGAPTSTCIANIVLDAVDVALLKVFRKHNFAYTRFVDDITMSGEIDLRPFKNVFYSAVQSAQYSISKYSVADRGKPQIVTGLIVNDKIRPTRQFIRQLKDDIKSGWPENETIEQTAHSYGYSIRELKNNILGRINFVRSVDNKVGREIRGLLVKTIWPKDYKLN